MKHTDSASRHKELLVMLHHLPKKIIVLHDQTDHVLDMPGFVLHDFCHDSCFNIGKVAYFVDNPDFNCFKGIAGICKREPDFCTMSDMWDDRKRYSTYLRASPFNNKVRSIEKESIKNNGEQHSAEQKLMDTIAQELAIEKPTYISWPMKHGNNGYLLVEKNDETAELIDEYLPYGVYLLSFCPIV